MAIVATSQAENPRVSLVHCLYYKLRSQYDLVLGNPLLGGFYLIFIQFGQNEAK